MAISKCRGKLVKEIITKSEVTIVLVAGVREVGISTILNECAEVLSKTSSVLTINSIQDINFSNGTIVNPGDAVIIDDIENITGLNNILAKLVSLKARIILGAHHRLSFFKRRRIIDVPTTEIEVRTFRLGEILEEESLDITKPQKVLNAKCDNYVKRGGFPKTQNASTSLEICEYINDLIDRIIINDIMPYISSEESYEYVRQKVDFVILCSGRIFDSNDKSISKRDKEINRAMIESFLITRIGNYNKKETSLILMIPTDISMYSTITGLNESKESAWAILIYCELLRFSYDVYFYFKNRYIKITAVCKKGTVTNYVQFGYNGKNENYRRNLDYSLISASTKNANKLVICVTNVMTYDKNIRCISFGDFIFYGLEPKP